MGGSAVHCMGGLSIKRVSRNFQEMRETVWQVVRRGRRRSRMRERGGLCPKMRSADFDASRMASGIRR